MKAVSTRLLLAAACTLFFMPATATAADSGASPAPSPMVSALNRANFAEALRLAQPLADAGAPQAEQVLGLMYANGWGVKQRFDLAASWYEKAAAQGVEAAQNNLGTLYMRGAGVPQDYAKAAYWFHKAADQGAAQSCFNLGDLYENGLGVPQDYKVAATWYRKAAEIALDRWYSANVPHP